MGLARWLRPAADPQWPARAGPRRQSGDRHWRRGAAATLTDPLTRGTARFTTRTSGRGWIYMRLSPRVKSKSGWESIDEPQRALDCGTILAQCIGDPLPAPAP